MKMLGLVLFLFSGTLLASGGYQSPCPPGYAPEQNGYSGFVCYPIQPRYYQPYYPSYQPHIILPGFSIQFGNQRDYRDDERREHRHRDRD